MSAWAASYEDLALTGVRSREVTERIVLHLRRFSEYLSEIYGHEWLASVVRRDVVDWRDTLVSSGLGASTVNNHGVAGGSAAGWWPGLNMASRLDLSDPTPPETEALAA